MGRLIGTTTLRLRSVQGYSFLASRNFTNAYTYDAVSNRTGFIDPERGSTAYTYDTLNRLTSLAPPSAFGSGSFGFSGVYPESAARERAVAPHADDAAQQRHHQLHLRHSVAPDLGTAPTVWTACLVSEANQDSAGAVFTIRRPHS
jgi:YD repeat-containing protein